jgi:acetyltransferase
MHTAGGIAKANIPVISTAEKPVVEALMGERLIQEAIEHFRAAHVPEYRFPERAAEALAVLARRAEYLAAGAPEAGSSPSVGEGSLEAVRSILSAGPFSGLLPQEQAFRVLAAYEVPVVQPRLARTAREAAALARELGFPVALKVAAKDISHKSDVGGVLLSLTDPQGVEEGFRAILENCRDALPGAEIEGVYIQRMLDEGQEVIIGTVQDPQFGPLVMFGSGGVDVEGLRDVRFALAPLPLSEAEAMLAGTLAGRKLSGYRNLLPADREAVLKIIRRVAQLASDFPEFTEIEINPLRVLGIGQGAFAVDVRARLID